MWFILVFIQWTRLLFIEGRAEEREEEEREEGKGEKKRSNNDI